MVDMYTFTLIRQKTSSNFTALANSVHPWESFKFVVDGQCVHITLEDLG